jgi:hypothetical protein
VLVVLLVYCFVLFSSQIPQMAATINRITWFPSLGPPPNPTPLYPSRKIVRLSSSCYLDGLYSRLQLIAKPTLSSCLYFGRFVSFFFPVFFFISILCSPPTDTTRDAWEKKQRKLCRLFRFGSATV